MRIRQVKPEFWADAELAGLPYQVRLFYIGLWNCADDFGYLDWRVERIAHDLFGYEPRAKREQHVQSWSETLVRSGHLVLLECGTCALIPTLTKHQRITGKQNARYREAHGKHLPLTGKHPIAPEQVVVNGTERNVDVTVGAREEQTSERRGLRETLAAMGLRPLAAEGQ